MNRKPKRHTVDVLFVITLFCVFAISVIMLTGIGANVYESIVAGQQATVDSLSDSRQQVLGVSSEEELQNIIKFQNAYNASSRYINVVDEMLEHIINTLAV